MPRTHKPRRRYVPKRVDPNPVDLAISSAATLRPHQRAELSTPITAAFQALRAGHGTAQHWMDLADAMNVAEALAELNIASDHGATFAAAQQALASVHARWQQRASRALYPAEINAIDDAVFVHGVQLEHCSQAEMQRAIEAVKRRTAQYIKGNASPGAHVCIGLLGAGDHSPAPQP